MHACDVLGQLICEILAGDEKYTAAELGLSGNAGRPTTPEGVLEHCINIEAVQALMYSTSFGRVVCSHHHRLVNDKSSQDANVPRPELFSLDRDGHAKAFFLKGIPLYESAADRADLARRCWEEVRGSTGARAQAGAAAAAAAGP